MVVREESEAMNTVICAACHGIGGTLSQSTGRMVSTCYVCGGMGEIEVDE